MIKKIAITVLAASLCMLSVRCIKSDGELGDSTVVINLGLDQAFNAPKTRFDRFMNFIMPKAYAAPSNIASVSIVVSAEDIKTFENSYSPPPTYITVTVPAGKSRFIQVIGYVKDGDPSAVLSYRGTLTADLEPGETKEVAMQMVTYETKLVIPDTPTNNGPFRLVQIDDMAGKNFIPKTGYASYTGTFMPYDVDFDARGRIYIANNTSGSGHIIRIDNISGSNLVSYTNNAVNGKLSIAIDRSRSLLYFSEGNAVFRTGLDGGTYTSITLSTVASNIRGMAIDDDGLLYIVGVNGAGSTSYLQKYNAMTGSGVLVLSHSLGASLYPWDVFVMDEYVLLAQSTAVQSGKKIIVFNKNFQFVNSLTGKPGSGDVFFGPHRFIAINNKKITLADCTEAGPSTGAKARILAFDNIDGDNFESYGSYGVGTGQFKLYNFC